ncbi:MAG: aldo/keto reductase, partial [Atopobiaceae bacterium]|nr:aldo/keto reductase [Atopobiaceae bacterium]
TDFVDLYYLHRMGSTPVEEVADAMGRLIDEGLIGGWGLSQVDVDVIVRAQAVTPLSAVQNIYSMVERDVEDEVIPYCAEHRIGLVAFSPVASGLLSGKVKSTAQFERVDDVRTWVPQLSERNLAANRPLVQMLEDFAAVKDCTPAQLSMAWMLAKWDNVVPIPGSKNKGRILENLGAAEVELTKDELAQLENALDGIAVYGHRGFTR